MKEQNKFVDLENNDDFLAALRNEGPIIAFTGAGVSAESGVPTFRGEDGLWKEYKPEELATPSAFKKNPKLVWEWYRFRRDKIRDVDPNKGHHALVKLENKFEEFSVITQNVDNLHQEAGNDEVIELHGNIFRNKCFECGKKEESTPKEHTNGIPICDSCGGKMRPDVVWFGEAIPHHEVRKAFQLSRNCSIFFSLGTSTLVQPAASLPVQAKEHGTFLIEVNIEETPITELADLSIKGKTGVILPQFLEFLEYLQVSTRP